jgi:cytochrome c oxidase subunit 3
MNRRTLYVAPLPDHAFGHKGLIWWGTVGFMVIEGSILLLQLVTYFYLRTRVSEWPPSLPEPALTAGSVNTLLMVVSLVPNHLAKRAAEHYDLHRVRIWLPVTVLFGIAFLVTRVFEFWSLGSRWDSNAYRSAVWVTMGLHTTHVITDVVDSAVLAVLMFTRHAEPRRLVDVSENALYWDFIVLTWVPIYLVIYFAPRWL